MAELKFQDLDEYFNKLTTDKIPHVVLIWGERYLVKKAFDKIIDFTIEKNKRALGYESLESDDANIPEIIERISTYSMMQEQLVVAAKDVPLFPGPGTPIVYGFSKQNLINLQKLIEKGFPPHHQLILTTSSADKRRSLFKTIKNTGIVIDCTVPSGSRQADKNQQMQLLRNIVQNILSKSDKKLTNGAFNALVDKTGFDPAVFADNLEKLISFAGEKNEIVSKDVASIVKRTKLDPVFELTNAIAEKNAEKALFYNKSLINAGFHPLQILTAMTNQIRKLILAKNFIEQSAQKKQNIWYKNQNYNQFLHTTMPEIIRADKEMLEKTASWNDNKSLENSKKKFKNILIASNPKSAYPVYQTFLKSDNFSIKELAGALIELGELDFSLKSSSGAPDILMEDLIIRICKNTAGTCYRPNGSYKKS